MKEPSTIEQSAVAHSTFVIERSYPAAPDRVFAAFADPAQKRRWLAEDPSRDVEQFDMDFRVGGADRACYRFAQGTPFPGTPLRYDTTYHDIVPGRRLVMAYTVTFGDRRISTSLVTVEFLAGAEGTELVFTEQGAFFEGADGPQIREAGWRRLLEKLAAELAR